MDARIAGTRFPGQFVLTRAEVPLPEGWLSEKTGSWILARHPSLPRIRLVDDGGRGVGWFLGFPIDSGGVLLADGSEVRLPWAPGGFDGAVEAFVYGFGGRFLAAFVEGERKRIYLDPLGSLSFVFCAHQEIVASTPGLIPLDERTGDHVDLARDLGIPHTNAKYPLETTPRKNVERCIPNHYLDLENWTRVRHWPGEPLREEESVGETAVAVAAIVKRQIAAVVSRTPTYLRLTSGGDSRMLLSCSKAVADRLVLFTVPVKGDGARVDVDIARRIAKRFGLRHFVPEFRESNREDLEEFMDRIGYSTGELRGWESTSMFRQADPAYAQLDGALGALDRGQYYSPDDTADARIAPERLMKQCCQGPCTERTLPALRRWLDAAPPGMDTFRLLDLFFVEQEMGAWAGILPYAEGGDPGFILYPMCHREIVTRMMTLPTEYKRNGFLNYERPRRGTPPFMREIISREWPELLEWPFNTPMGMTKIALDSKNAYSKLIKILNRYIQ